MNKKNATKPAWIISSYWLDMSRSLFEHLDDVTGELTADQSKAALVLELARIETLVADLSSRFGRPGSSRKGIARAFLVKATLNIPATKDLIERLRVDTRLRRLCGFKAKVPSESTFSRAFKAMADSGVLDQAHERAVRAHYADAVVHHVSRDSTAIKVREEPLAKPKPEPREKQKCGRKCKGEVRKRTRQETQAEQSWPESLSELPKGCALGVKKNSKGKQEFWIGYKSHVDVADGGVPLSFCTTSATLHDSQAAIPLMKMTNSRVGTVFYQLMDKAYFAELIFKAAAALGQVAIVPAKNYQTKPAVPLDPAQKKRFQNRTTVERFFCELKENHGGNHIRVKGWAKVHAHLMCGVLTIFALACLRL